MKGAFGIELTRLGGDWPQSAEASAEAAIAATLAAEAGSLEGLGETTVSVAFGDDQSVRALNHDYRGRDSATNVLSFPSGVLEDGMVALPPDVGVPLGDIVFALETVRAEAVRDGKSLEDHLTHLAVHGTLHLLGYDHESDAEAEVMEDRERFILAGLGVEDPYGDTDLQQDGKTADAVERK